MFASRWKGVAMKRRLVLGVVGAVVLLAATAVAGFFCVRNLVAEQRLRGIGGMLVDREILLMHWRSLEPDKHFQSVIQHLADDLNGQTHTVRFLSPDKSLEREQPRSAFERQVLDRFAKRKPGEIAKQDGPEYREGPITEHEEYQYFQAIRAERNCTRTCHVPNVSALPTSPENSPIGRAAPGGQKWREGDLMAVVEVTIPLPARGP
jgi:hypothetical protein